FGGGRPPGSANASIVRSAVYSIRSMPPWTIGPSWTSRQCSRKRSVATGAAGSERGGIGNPPIECSTKGTAYAERPQRNDQRRAEDRRGGEQVYLRRVPATRVPHRGKDKEEGAQQDR